MSKNIIIQASQTKDFRDALISAVNTLTNEQAQAFSDALNGYLKIATPEEAVNGSGNNLMTPPLTLQSIQMNAATKAQGAKADTAIQANMLGSAAFFDNDDFVPPFDAIFTNRPTVNGVGVALQSELSGSSYKGTWDADTNTPEVIAGEGTNGEYYVVNVAGTQNITGASIYYLIGDQIRFNGAEWEHVPKFDAVNSVAGKTGAVTLTASDVSGVATAAQGTKADSALQPLTGVYKVDTFANASSVTLPNVVSRLYVENRQAYFKEVVSEPSHALKFVNNGRWFELDELVVTPVMAGAVVNGVTDDTISINNIIAFAKLKNMSIDWPEGNYLTTASIVDFHAVKHTGYGRIIRGSDVWYITPRGDNERNIIYVGGTNLTANDGFSRDQPTNISQAIDRIRNIGTKSQDGRWQIRIFGTITSSGQTLRDLPVFRNRLEIWGDAADFHSVPTTIWDGTSSAPVYAICGDWNNNLANAYLHFRNIKFINWNKSTNAGGIVIWASGDVLSENIHSDNCSIGEWYRQCYVRTVYGTISNAQTFGVGIQYSASGNVGNLTDGGKTFVNCEINVAVGRCSTVYIQSCDMSGAYLIQVSRNARIRTQNNIFREWTNAVVYSQVLGAWTPDNFSGYPDTYLMTPTDAAPVFVAEHGSVHSHIQRNGPNLNSYNAQGSTATISGLNGVQTLLSTHSGVAAGDFVPARVPSWWAYSPSAKLEVEMYVTLAANASGVLALHGNGSTAPTLLAQITFPVSASVRQGIVKLTFVRRKNSSTGRYYTYYIAGANSLFNVGSTANLSSASIRAASENILNYRLYWTPADDNAATFSDMRTYIEV